MSIAFSLNGVPVIAKLSSKQMMGAFVVLGLGVFTLISLALGAIGGLLYLLIIFVQSLLTVSFFLPALSIILLCLIAVLLSMVIVKLILALVHEYRVSSRTIAGVA